MAIRAGPRYDLHCILDCERMALVDGSLAPCLCNVTQLLTSSCDVPIKVKCRECLLRTHEPEIIFRPGLGLWNDRNRIILYPNLQSGKCGQTLRSDPCLVGGWMVSTNRWSSGGRETGFITLITKRQGSY